MTTIKVIASVAKVIENTILHHPLEVLCETGKKVRSGKNHSSCAASMRPDQWKGLRKGTDDGPVARLSSF